MNLVRKHTSKKPSAGTYFLCFVIGLFLGYIFLQMPKINAEVSREDVKCLTGDFQECHVDYRKGHIHSIGLTLSSAGKQFVHKSCVSSSLIEALSALPTDTEMTLLIHPTSDYILEIQVEGQVLLEFEHSQELLISNATGFAFLGIGMLILGIIGGINFVILEIKLYHS